jgi:hypothetical protein
MMGGTQSREFAAMDREQRILAHVGTFADNWVAAYSATPEIRTQLCSRYTFSIVLYELHHDGAIIVPNANAFYNRELSAAIDRHQPALPAYSQPMFINHSWGTWNAVMRTLGYHFRDDGNRQPWPAPELELLDRLAENRSYFDIEVNSAAWLTSQLMFQKELS